MPVTKSDWYYIYHIWTFEGNGCPTNVIKSSDVQINDIAT